MERTTSKNEPMRRKGKPLHFYTRNYARYLANHQSRGSKTTARMLWAHYQLGRYRSVVERHEALNHWRRNVALAVSAAACGEPLLMESALEAVEAGPLSQRERHTMARRLAAFAPEAALRSLEGQTPSVLQAALLEKTGQQEEAMSILKGFTSENRQGRGNAAEAILLSANLHLHTGGAKLAAVNRYLKRYGLEPVHTDKPGDMPCPQTIETEYPTRHCTGPLVSVIMTTYNCETRFESALRSLLRQTYEAIEIIVVDDCSNDDTANVVLHMQQENPRIRFIRLPVNVGTYVAKTLGVELANGEFITCHDSDDWSHPSKVARQVQPFRWNPNLVATVSRWVRLDDQGQAYNRSTYPLLHVNRSSVLFRKHAVMTATGLWDSSRTGADSEFLARIKLVFGRHRVWYLRRPLSFGAHRVNSLMTAKSTGMDTGPMHPDRLDYWQAWSDWHIQMLSEHKIPQMPTIDSERPFKAPTALNNDPESLMDALEWWKEYKSAYN